MHEVRFGLVQLREFLPEAAVETVDIFRPGDVTGFEFVARAQVEDHDVLPLAEQLCRFIRVYIFHRLGLGENGSDECGEQRGEKERRFHEPTAYEIRARWQVAQFSIRTPTPKGRQFGSS